MKTDYIKNIMNNGEKEYILCAACWYKDIELKKVFEECVLPYNCDRGLVFCGWRHAQCMYSMISITGKRQSEAGEEIQGFLTNKNRFVDRREALEIAKQANQLNNRTDCRVQLYSEDLY